MKRAAIVLATGVVLLALSLWLFRGGNGPAAQAREAYQRGDFATAVRAYQEAAPGCSDLSALAAGQAAALYRLDHYSEADGRYQLAEAKGDDQRAARAAYDRGNCALRQACQVAGTPDQALLDRAAEQFRACLDRQRPGADSESVLDDARYNLELTKLLHNAPSAQAEQTARKESEQDKSQSGSSENEKSGEAPSGHGTDTANNNAADASHTSTSATDENKPSTNLASLTAHHDDEDYLCPD